MSVETCTPGTNYWRVTSIVGRALGVKLLRLWKKSNEIGGLTWIRNEGSGMSHFFPQYAISCRLPRMPRNIQSRRKINAALGTDHWKWESDYAILINWKPNERD